VVPIGTRAKAYEASHKEMDIWENKLSLLGDKKVWLKRSIGREVLNAKR